MAKTDFKSIDEYIAACPKESRAYVQQIRKTVHALVPKAKEKISYQLAAFELNSKNLIAFAGWKNHVSIYPIPAGTKAFNDKVAKYAAGRGTVQFPLDQPLPLPLIKQIIKNLLADNLKKTKKH